MATFQIGEKIESRLAEHYDWLPATVLTNEFTNGFDQPCVVVQTNTGLTCTRQLSDCRPLPQIEYCQVFSSQGAPRLGPWRDYKTYCGNNDGSRCYGHLCRKKDGPTHMWFEAAE